MTLPSIHRVLKVVIIATVSILVVFAASITALYSGSPIAIFFLIGGTWWSLSCVLLHLPLVYFAFKAHAGKRWVISFALALLSLTCYVGVFYYFD